MKFTKMKLTGLGAFLVLTFCSFGVYAEKNKEPNPMNKDQVEGRVDEATGVITDDKDKRVEGNVQKNMGKAQKGYGDAKKAIKEGN
ncbi:MAG: CsbD family protein [Methylobacter sp.]|nr:CsbD family protein [Methylobacter sp.]